MVWLLSDAFGFSLRCVASQQGILQQWLLLVCYLAPPPSEHLAHAQHRYQPFVTGRQVVATVAQNPDHVTQCMELNANAKPFYPLPLRTLFDTPACTFVRGASPATMLLGPQVPVPHELLPAMHNLCRVEVACDASVMQVRLPPCPPCHMGKLRATAQSVELRVDLFKVVRLMLHSFWMQQGDG